MSQPDLAIILVSWNTRELLLACLASLHASVGSLSYETIVVDNGSHDGSVEAVRTQFPHTRLIVNAHNPGFAGANNQGIQASRGRYVLLLNSDTIAPPGSIERLVRFADSQPQAGLVGGLLLNPDSSFQYSFTAFPTLGSELLSASGLGERLFHHGFPSYPASQSRQTRQVEVIPGACMLARRSAVEQVGLMDEAYFMYSEETDWCWRMRRAGWEVWYVPAAPIIHYGGQSTSQVRNPMVLALYRSKVRFFRLHYGLVQAVLLCCALVLILQLRWLVRGKILGQDVGSIPGWQQLWDAPATQTVRVQPRSL
ncbi:MAG: glycosyltransferase family 2 protein [Oscillochloridaceae bacterium umkhey_bin13]